MNLNIFKKKKKHSLDAKERADRLFNNPNLFKALIWVAVPGIIIALMQGLFIFADQLMMVNLIPNAGSPNMGTLFPGGANQPDLSDAWNNIATTWNTHATLNGDISAILPTFSIDSLVRYTVSMITPPLYILNAITILIGMGTAVSYSKSIGANDKERAYNAWTTGVFSTVCISLVSSAIVIGIANMWIAASAGGLESTEIASVVNANSEYFNSNFGSTATVMQTYNHFYTLYRSQAVDWATQYIYIAAAGNILACFNQYFSLMIRAEGKQLYPALLAAFANSLNIILDYIFISICKFGIFGSVSAMLIGWGSNVLFFVLYVWWLNMKHQTFLKFSKLKFSHFRRDILYAAIGIGIGAAIWNSGIALLGTMQNSFLASTTTDLASTIGVPPSYYIELNGAVLPIVNLTFTAMYGIVAGGRALISYNYGSGQIKRVKRTYFYAMIVSVAYGLLMYLVIGYGINVYLLRAFNITQGISEFIPGHPGLINPLYTRTLANAQYFLSASMLQVFTYSFALSGIVLFQSIGSILLAALTSGMQGFITSAPSFLIMQAIAVHAHDMNIFLYALPVNSALSAILVLAISLFYIHKFLGREDNKARLFFKKLSQKMANYSAKFHKDKNNKKVATGDLNKNKLNTLINIKTLNDVQIVNKVRNL